MAVRNPRSPGVTITPWESVHCEADARLELPAAGATKLHLGIEQRPGGSELAIEHGPDTARMAVPAAERAQYEQVAFGGADAPLRTAAAAGTQLSFIGLRTAPLP